MTKERQAQKIAVQLRRKYRTGKLSPSQIESLKNVGFDFHVTSFHNKELLLKMAREGKPRPSWNTKLRMCLCQYLRKKSDCYDAEFEKKLRKLRPDWFEKSSDANKEILLKMAREGKPIPPSWNTKLGRCLCNYTCKSHGSYDAEFEKKLRKIRPDWFFTQFDISKQNKELLLKMAREGKPRPSSKKTKLGMCLCRYTCKNNGSYDAEFEKELRKIRPDWFRK